MTLHSIVINGYRFSKYTQWFKIVKLFIIFNRQKMHVLLGAGRADTI